MHEQTRDVCPASHKKNNQRLVYAKHNKVISSWSGISNCVYALKGLYEPTFLSLQCLLNTNSLDLKEVNPIKYSKNIKKVYSYKRIKVENLSKDRIVTYYINSNFKNVPSVVDFDQMFIIQFQSRPIIVISKITGRLYSFLDKWDLEQIQHQASIVIEVLNTYSEVEDLKSKVIRRKRYGNN